MIIRENLNINGKPFVKTCSSEGFMVEREGVRYCEAIDPAELERIYTETEVFCEEMTEIGQKAAAYDILMGVSE